MPPFTLQHKTAIVTGAGKGIGKSIATVFARQGANVYILDMDEEAANETVQEIASENGQAHFYKTDVAKQQQVASTVTDIYQETGSIDILINNAGIAHIGNLEDTTEDDFDRIMNVNVKGVYNCSQAVIKPMKKQKKGVIINMASVASSLGISERFAYSTSKGAVLTMTYSIAKDYLDYNIRCNAISPARVHTPFVDGYLHENYPGEEEKMFEQLSKTQPIGRMGKPEEIANLALYLCSDEAGFITGTNYPIDGGFTTLNT